MNSFKSMVWVLPLIILSGCQTNNVSEIQRFEVSVRKELPFRIDSLHWFDGVDMPTYQFASHDYITALPDAEIGMNGDVSVYRTFDYQNASLQTEDKVWRNVVVSKKNQRIICIDRYLRDGRTQGYVYVLQCETKKFPTLGNYHWDVSDPHNIESAGAGRPQKYGTQRGQDGLCPLLDDTRVNEWRKEVGLLPIEIK